MGDWPVLQHTRYQQDDATGASAYGTTLGSAGGANTKGSYTELVASAPFDADALICAMQIDRDVGYLVDIAVGAAASEKILVPNLPFNVVTGGGGSAHGYQTCMVPAAVRKGARISARMQAGNSGTPTRGFKLHLIAKSLAGLQGASRWADWGTVTATSLGTVVTGGAVNTKGAWAQLVAAADFTTRWVVLSLAGGTIDAIKIDIGVGGSGSEKVLVPDIVVTNEHMSSYILLPLQIRAGVRVSARLAAAGGASTQRVSILGGA